MRASRRRRPPGFGLMESLLSLFLVGLVLGLVARGYQALNRLSVASYEMSQRLELNTFVRRLSAEATTALSVVPETDTLTITRTDPGLNLLRNESRDRLPWPIPVPRPASANLDAFRIDVVYAYSADQHVITRTQNGVSTVAVENVGGLETSLSGRILGITVKPENLTAPVITSVYLPVVTP